MRPKTRPTKGFRQKMLATEVKGLNATINAMISPKMETHMLKVKMQLLILLPILSRLKEVFELLYYSSACHVPKDSSLHLVAGKDTSKSSAPRSVEGSVTVH